MDYFIYSEDLYLAPLDDLDWLFETFTDLQIRDFKRIRRRLQNKYRAKSFRKNKSDKLKQIILENERLTLENERLKRILNQKNELQGSWM